MPLPTASNAPDRYLPALTGVRAVAAYLVFLHHYNPAPPGTFAHRLFDQGYTGVTVFFVLSGFLIHHRYADAYFTRQNWSWRGYLQNRFARIYPVYGLLLLVTVGVHALLGKPLRYDALALNVTLLKGFFDAYKFSGIAQSWSLTTELSFYLLAPLLFLPVRRWGVIGLTASLVGTGVLLWVLSTQLAWPYGLFGSLPFVLFYTFFGRAFEFVLGIWLAQRLHQRRLPAVRYPGLTGLLLIGFCVSWQAGLPTFNVPPPGLIWSEVVVYNLGLPLGVGLLFLSLLTQPSLPKRVLSGSVGQALGKSSYAFYLIHTGVVAAGLQKAGATNRWILFGLLVGLGYALSHFVERPLQRWLRAR